MKGLVLSGTLGALLACHLAAQAPLLRVAYAADPDAPDLMITARNVYGAPASEFIVYVRYYLPVGAACDPASIDPSGRCTAASGRHWAPAFAPQTLLHPGAAANFRAGWQAGEMISALNVAVIYADGQMAGDPVVLRQMLAERAAYVADLQSAIPLLDQAASATHPDTAALAAVFQQRQQAHTFLLSAARPPDLPRSYGPSDDRACGKVVAMLNTKHGQGPEGASARLRQIARDIQIIVTNALASKPKLALPPAPGANR